MCHQKASPRDSDPTKEQGPMSEGTGGVLVGKKVRIELNVQAVAAAGS